MSYAERIGRARVRVVASPLSLNVSAQMLAQLDAGNPLEIELPRDCAVMIRFLVDGVVVARAELKENAERLTAIVTEAGSGCGIEEQEQCQISPKNSRL